MSTFQYFRELSTNGQATVELSRKNDDRVLWLKLESKLNSSLGIILTTITDETEKYILKQKVEQHKNLNAIGQMTASIAHEIRNPMTSLKGFIELLKINCSENEKKYLNVMNSELERMDSILSEILYLSNPNERIYEEVQFTKIIHN
ncbi:PAS domain-containing sensor histidine kinase, partial [Butyricicoccus sp. 1XD8-22]